MTSVAEAETILLHRANAERRALILVAVKAVTRSMYLSWQTVNGLFPACLKIDFRLCFVWLDGERHPGKAR